MEGRTVFIGDVHGDDQALSDSLFRAGDAENIVLLGDWTDRGKKNTGVLDRILKLQNNANIALTLIAGNHDILLHRAVLRRDEDSIWRWFYKASGWTFLKEIAIREQMYLPQVSQICIPVPGKGTDEDQWRNFIAQCGLCGLDLLQAFEELSVLILGKYAPLYTTMQIAARIHECCLAVHADVPELLVTNGVEESNERFRIMRDNAYRGMTSTEESALQSRIDDEGGSCLSMSATAVVREGVQLVVHGHCFDRKGIPIVRQFGDVTALQLDVGMSRGCSASPAAWGYGTIEENGNVVIESSVMRNPVVVGRIEHGTFVRSLD